MSDYNLKTYKLRLVVEYTVVVEAGDKQHAWDKFPSVLVDVDGCSSRVIIEETEVVE